MRRLLLLALVVAASLAALGCAPDEPVQGQASIVLDIPNGELDPVGYTSVEITIHEASGDTVREAVVTAERGFELGDLEPRLGASIEAVLRDDSGAAVGYGRTPGAIDLAAGSTVTVQVRRPIVYIAGVNYTVPAQNVESWFGLPATFSDLTTGAALDGTTMAADKPVLMVSAGPQLYAIDQGVATATGALMGPATIRAVSAADHTMSEPLGQLLLGEVQDGAGSDDGSTLVIGTSQRLYAVDARPGAAAPVRELAQGNFSRVAMVALPDGGASAVAIEDRVDTAGACAPTAKLWWIGATGGEVIEAKVVATGGFADVAADRGRAWYVDACRGEFGEATDAGARAVRVDLGKPTALAVSNGQAWIGIERAPMPPVPATLTLVVTSVEATAGMRTLWSEPQDQILGATAFPGVERRLPAQAATFQQLEIGAGGDYVAAATSGAFFGARVAQANFPMMDIETRELRVFDAASGGVIQRYRSWCDGVYTIVSLNEIQDWRCATTTGQRAPVSFEREHRLSSMTFLFGKK